MFVFFCSFFQILKFLFVWGRTNNPGYRKQNGRGEERRITDLHRRKYQSHFCVCPFFFSFLLVQKKKKQKKPPKLLLRLGLSPSNLFKVLRGQENINFSASKSNGERVGEDERGEFGGEITIENGVFGGATKARMREFDIEGFESFHDCLLGDCVADSKAEAIVGARGGEGEGGGRRRGGGREVMVE